MRSAFRWVKLQITRRWEDWRINRWLRLRRAGVARDEALRRSYLTAGRTFEILDGAIGGRLSTVGLATARGGRITLSYDFPQIALVLRALADLAPSLGDEDQRKIAELIDELRMHNWGGVRRGADAAKQILAGAVKEIQKS